jgi:hypothetical protein
MNNKHTFLIIGTIAVLALTLLVVYSVDTPVSELSTQDMSEDVERRLAEPVDPETPTTPPGKLKADVFSGTLEAVDTGCFADGECFVVVDGKHVTALRGWSRDTVGSVQGVEGFGDLESYIGKQVEVYAQDLSDGTYTLYGSEGFYIKILSSDGNAGTVACREDAKICPNGSAVGRVGPNCEFAPCPDISPQGTIKGVVLMGPTCPVMREGDTACADKPYETDIQVMRISDPDGVLVAETRTDADGAYSIVVPYGSYSIQAVVESVFPRCDSIEITVNSATPQIGNISCDTGIR